MDIGIEVKGLDKLKGATDQIRLRVAEELAKGMYLSMKRVEETAKKSIADGDKSGRIYKRGNVLHRSSAAGEAPASDTGRLMNSIIGDVDRSALSNGLLEGKVVAKTKYANWLEFGTIKMAARPFMHPALEKNKAWISNRLALAVKRGMSGNAR